MIKNVMAKRLPRPCSQLGCPALAGYGGYCEKHRKIHERQYAAQRGTSCQRGYSSDWQHVRFSYLQEHPLCEQCENAGQVVLAIIVHHKIPLAQGGSRLDQGNLMALCVACHDKLHKTNKMAPLGGSKSLGKNLQ